MKERYKNKITDHTRSEFLVYDPVSFTGGSKVAMSHIIEECPNSRPIIITCDPDSWKSTYKIISIYLPKRLQRASSGLPFYGKQLLLGIQLSIIFLSYFRIKKIAVISGPAVDISALLLSQLFRKYAIQLIQGPISRSKIALLGLSMSRRIFYLASCQQNITDLIQHKSESDIANIHQKSAIFTNGLPQHQWPTPTLNINADDIRIDCKDQDNTNSLPSSTSSRVFWAASLLKWKGIDILEKAINCHLKNTDIQAKICYIKPQNTALDCHPVPQNNNQISVWENPDNLDEIRSQCNIFVSTSQHEPFGLSILEAMAARLCPVIPKDGAYWDMQLTHGVNCFKYTPNDPQSLARILWLLSRHAFCITSTGQRAQDIASQYKAKDTYRAIVQALSEASFGNTPPKLNPRTKG